MDEQEIRKKAEDILRQANAALTAQDIASRITDDRTRKPLVKKIVNRSMSQMLVSQLVTRFPSPSGRSAPAWIWSSPRIARSDPLHAPINLETTHPKLIRPPHSICTQADQPPATPARIIILDLDQKEFLVDRINLIRPAPWTILACCSKTYNGVEPDGWYIIRAKHMPCKGETRRMARKGEASVRLIVHVMLQIESGRWPSAGSVQIYSNNSGFNVLSDMLRECNYECDIQMNG